MEYIIKTEIDGVEIRLIKSQHGYAVVYGMQRTSHTTFEHALDDYRSCVRHALECMGLFDE